MSGNKTNGERLEDAYSWYRTCGYTHDQALAMIRGEQVKKNRRSSEDERQLTIGEGPCKTLGK